MNYLLTVIQVLSLSLIAWSIYEQSTDVFDTWATSTAINCVTLIIVAQIAKWK